MTSSITFDSELKEIKTLLLGHDPAFWFRLRSATETAKAFDELFFLASLRKKAIALGMTPDTSKKVPVRLAMLGGCSLYPLHELVTQLLESAGFQCELFLGEYDNFVSEIMEQESELYSFKPDVVFILPGPQRSGYHRELTDDRS